MYTTDISLAVVVVIVVVDVVVVIVVAVVLASGANNHSQNNLVLSSELPIRCAIYEGVDGTTQINQERVCKVHLSLQSVFPARGVNVIHDRDRKPTTCEADHYCCQSRGHFCFFHVRSELLKVILLRENLI